LTGLVLLPLLTVGMAQLRGVLNLPSQTLLYLLAVVVVALVGGLVPALATAVAAAVLLDHYFIPPLYDFAVGDPDNLVALVGFVLVAGVASSVVGLAARRREAEEFAIANAESREGFRRLAEEQAALRRVATLVAGGMPSPEVLSSVAQEVGRVLGAHSTNIVRFDADGAATVVASVGQRPEQVPVGTRWKPEPPLATATVLRTGRPARSDDYSEAAGIAGDAVRRLEIRSGVATPIVVEGRLWGAINVGTQGERFPADAEQRMVDFTELVGAAIANAEGHAQLERSRDELRRLAAEQAALRRVATLVARGVPAAEVFAAVAQEVGSVLGADATPIARLDPDGAVTVVAVAGDPPDGLAVGSRWNLEPPLAYTEAMRTGRPARDEGYDHAPGPVGAAIRRMGIQSGVAAPVVVEGQLWGVIAIVGWHGRFPDGTEERMSGFTELLGTAMANAEGRAQLERSRDELRVLAEEQAALRRVATLVARGVPAAEVFPAVAQEVGHILGAAASMIGRLDPDGAITVVSRVGEARGEIPVGSRWRPEPPLATAEVLRTGRPARCDDYSEASGAFFDATVRTMGIRSSVAGPIVVEGRLWGVIVAGVRHEHFPADAEVRMAGFTELIGTAIANAEGRDQLEESRDQLRLLAEEQAALRRVATLVARGVPPTEVFSAVADEVGRVVGADGAGISRLDPDGAISVCAVVGSLADALAVGSRWRPEPPLALAVVLRTGRPARNEDYRQDAGLPPLGIRSGVAVPIVVEGRLWGAISVTSRQGPLPADTEARMAGFTELVGTAIANADSRDQLAASRARIVATADEARRHIERDLHDGTQQRLVALSLTLRVAQSTVPADLPELQDRIGQVADELTGTIDELREIARGIHPAILSEGGLGPALRTLARRAAIPVELDIRTRTRAAGPIEVAAYYVVSEALTNATKHARASGAQVAVDQRDGLLDLSIRDDGVGGADPAGGSGLIGLRDRVQALGGSIEVHSPPGAGTAIVVELPLQPQ
jgi:GAF domain-containing protein